MNGSKSVKDLKKMGIPMKNMAAIKPTRIRTNPVGALVERITRRHLKTVINIIVGDIRWE